MLWELLPSHNCSFSTERRDYQVDFLPEISNDPWNIFQKINVHFINLNVNSFLSKIDQIRYTVKLTYTTAIGLSGTKLDNTVLSSDPEIDDYDLV